MLWNLKAGKTEKSREWLFVFILLRLPVLSACNHTEFYYRESCAVIDVSNRRKHLIFLVLRLDPGMYFLCSNNCTKLLFTPRKRTLSLVIVQNKEGKWTESVRWMISAVWNISRKNDPFFCRCIFCDTLWFVFYLLGWKWQRNQPCLAPGWFSSAKYIYCWPIRHVMSWAKGKVKIPSRSLSHGFTGQYLPLRVTAVRWMKNI